MSLFFKSLNFSFKLLYRSSKLLFLVYLLLQVACSLTPLLSTYILKDLLNCLVSAEPAIKLVWLYIASIVLFQVFQSVQSVCYDTIQKKAEHQYKCDLTEKMNSLPLAFIDSSEGRNIIDEVRYLELAVINLPNYLIQTIAYLFFFIVAFSELISFHFVFSFVFIALTVP